MRPCPFRKDKLRRFAERFLLSRKGFSVFVRSGSDASGYLQAKEKNIFPFRSVSGGAATTRFARCGIECGARGRALGRRGWRRKRIP